MEILELKNIIGVKDATGDLNRVNQTLEKMGKDFIQLTGNDDNALAFNSRGGVGAISVTANIVPKLCSDFQKSSQISSNEGKLEATRLDQILQPIHSSMFIESNPSPVKYAAKLLGLCDDTVRLPLVSVTEKTKVAVKNALVLAKLPKQLAGTDIVTSLYPHPAHCAHCTHHLIHDKQVGLTI